MERSWSLRPATPADAAWLAALRAVGLRPDLERLGRWDDTAEQRVRQRFLTEYVPGNTDVIEHEGRPVGGIAIRPEPAEQWLEHFYLDPAVRGLGLGSQVLHHVLDAHRDSRPYRLVVVRGSRAVRLYERAGFTHESDHPNGVDLIMRAAGSRAVPQQW
ncbi:GNAT family N-acetyltransferase [Symbioplanes lichenis]|uniref:GNAT family N-acetyltransferase n=1 Tax=Symbioplanes lichenis TaxID=1629072 RepID=UPI002739A378|nr:GNAT family N-acetyltransferase [Actinoplanes lichenis]